MFFLLCSFLKLPDSETLYHCHVKMRFKAQVCEFSE